MHQYQKQSLAINILKQRTSTHSTALTFPLRKVVTMVGCFFHQYPRLPKEDYEAWCFFHLLTNIQTLHTNTLRFTHRRACTDSHHAEPFHTQITGDSPHRLTWQTHHAFKLDHKEQEHAALRINNTRGRFTTTVISE